MLGFQESRIAVVSSTAAATLRQLVMFVVDKVVDEDRRLPDASSVLYSNSNSNTDPNAAAAQQELELVDTTLPDGTVKALGTPASDAFAIFKDLCLLANSERPRLLKLEFLHKTFALELIESVLGSGGMGSGGGAKPGWVRVLAMEIMRG